MANTDLPDATEIVGSRSKTVPWYHESIGDKLGAAARDLLENYSKIPPEEVEDHIYRIRSEAWNIWPYPCIGGFRFLDLAISLSPDYPLLLQRLKSGHENFLDLGCCFGQELRKLAADGAPQDHLYGSDLRPEFFELGYELFGDKETLKSKFIAADIFDPSSPISSLDGNIDIIYAGSFLHLFNYAEQVDVCKRMVKLLRDKKGSMVLGRQVGSVDAGEYAQRMNKGQSKFRHNEESFKKMWDEVGELTGTKWRAEAELTPLGEEFQHRMREGNNDGVRRLRFSVFRV